MSYPPDFQSWPLERRNAWFAAEAPAYRETKAPGNGAADHAKLQGVFDGFFGTITALPCPIIPRVGMI
jgi:hypothetical protein